ncbi:MAG: tRNA pseudouridine(55) synthase TruB [Ruminococcus sp.]|nr:tRNA pseudouridine(55) synthase TruB [Ruminococcus sp.]
MNGIIVINKPMDFTSFDVVAVMRRATGQRKIGHLGTLDPNATGVLPLVLGNATKAQDLIQNHDKGYIAGFKLGTKTDTLDIWGKPVAKSNLSTTEEKIVENLEKFKGEILQTPPMYSAVQVDGKRLYDLARQGKTVERKQRAVTVYSIQLLEFDKGTQSGKIEVNCSKGTYIRTIIDDLGEALGTYAVMTSLVRTSACGYTLSDAVDLQSAREMTDFSSVIKSTESLFMNYRYVKISEAQSRRFSNGGSLDTQRTALQRLSPSEGEIFRVKSADETFLGLGIVKSSELKIYKLFKT